MVNTSDLYAAHLDGAVWRKSSYTANNGQCVEVAEIPGLPAVAIRDSKTVDVPAARVSAPAWAAFLQALSAGTLTS